MVTKERLAELRAQRDPRLTRSEIAKILGLSLAKVKRLLAQHELTNKRVARPDEPSTRLSPEAGMTKMERALFRLKGRVTETPQGYRLDGTPVNSWAILRAAGLAD